MPRLFICTALRLVLFISAFVYNTPSTFANEDEREFILNMSLEQLLNIDVVTASLTAEKVIDAPSNITLITREMIEQRGYQTLVEMLEDLPGFDFLVYQDGGGEYPTFSTNRGLGELGNDKLLIMVDGIVQNFISYNWSTQWTFEALLQDVSHLEVIQGPGSSLYGAQAFSGVINFITEKEYQGGELKITTGQDNTRALDAIWGSTFAQEGHYYLALHKYKSSGDKGQRYDPGNYWHNNLHPASLQADYDNLGNYVTNTENPLQGTPMPQGFNTRNNSYSARGRLTWKTSRLGAYLWQTERGGASYVSGIEYKSTDSSFTGGHRGYHLYLRDSRQLTTKWRLDSDLVFRSTKILPNTGIKYHWRFPELIKSYKAKDYQKHIEQRLHLELSQQHNFIGGVRYMWSKKSDRIISLNDVGSGYHGTNSSWDIAVAGQGLNQYKAYPKIPVHEHAFYLLWQAKWNETWSTSAGLRLDDSSEYGEVTNPRLGIIYKPRQQELAYKFLYATAFRQPSIFELNSEFRGNDNLVPEEIETYEIEISSLLWHQLSLKGNLFYSSITDFVGKVPDPDKLAGERFENISGKTRSRGLSFESSYQISETSSLYFNYMLLEGKDESHHWGSIPRTAKHKANTGVNWQLPRYQLNINFRINYVGKRLTQKTNSWLRSREGKFAPGYFKANLVLGYQPRPEWQLQLIVKNLFNENYYGIGRESGGGNSDDYDPQSNINPPGFIPAYHPQPGRNAILKMTYSF